MTVLTPVTQHILVANFVVYWFATPSAITPGGACRRQTEIYGWVPSKSREGQRTGVSAGQGSQGAVKGGGVVLCSRTKVGLHPNAGARRWPLVVSASPRA